MPEDDELIQVREQLFALHTGARPEFGDVGLFLNLSLALDQHNGPISMGDLSRALSVPLSSATRVVDLMVKSSFVERLPDPDDRRVGSGGVSATGRREYRAGKTHYL